MVRFLTSRSGVLLEKLTVSQLGNKFPAFYGTRRFIAAFTSACHLSLSWARSIQSTPHILKIHLNIILPSMPGSYKWTHFFVSLQKPCILLSSPPHMLHAPPILFFSFRIPEWLVTENFHLYYLQSVPVTHIACFCSNSWRCEVPYRMLQDTVEMYQWQWPVCLTFSPALVWKG